MLAEGRALFELLAFYAGHHLLALLAKGDGHPVLVLPEFLASDTSTAPLRNLLCDLGYQALGWELGRNVKVDRHRVRQMENRLLQIHNKTGSKVSIIGWSLGGVFARELAKMLPLAVRQVITLGSPISDDPRHTNVSGLFELINGRDPAPTHDGPFKGLGVAPPLPTSSIMSRTDGIVYWRGSEQHPESGHVGTENIEVNGSHGGMRVNPSVMVAIADRLAQAEGEWKAFKPKWSQQWMFPLERPFH